jgi:hypothetical protein
VSIDVSPNGSESPPPPPGEPPPPKKDPDNSQAIIILVLGVLSLFTCQLLGPVALFMGMSYRRRAQEAGYEPDPMAVIGMVLGAVGTALFLLSLLTIGGVCCLYAVMIIFAMLGAIAGA